MGKSVGGGGGHDACQCADVSRQEIGFYLTDSWGRVFVAPLAPPATAPTPAKRMSLDRKVMFSAVLFPRVKLSGFRRSALR